MSLTYLALSRAPEGLEYLALSRAPEGVVPQVLTLTTSKIRVT